MSAGRAPPAPDDAERSCTLLSCRDEPTFSRAAPPVCCADVPDVPAEELAAPTAPPCAPAPGISTSAGQALLCRCDWFVSKQMAASRSGVVAHLRVVGCQPSRQTRPMLHERPDPQMDETRG